MDFQNEIEKQRFETNNSRYTEFYYQNNAKELHKIVDKILKQFSGVVFQKDFDEFYSLANRIFVYALKNCDTEQNFRTFLYTCLDRKIKSEITYQLRDRRKSYARDKNGEKVLDERGKPIIIQDLSIYSKRSNNDDDSLRIIDMLSDTNTAIENIIGDSSYSDEIRNYLRCLSIIQREILGLLSAGYKAGIIQKYLHITPSQYRDHMLAIRAYEHVTCM